MQTPKSFRCHIGIYGRCNVGKSSLMNMITRQQVSIVSKEAGTTTDPVEKAMEFLPLGPVLLIDTAGTDDISDLGQLRNKKTKEIFDRTDLVILVTESNIWAEFEEQIFQEFTQRKIPIIIVLNKIDLYPVDQAIIKRFGKKHCVALSTKNPENLILLRKAILEIAPEEFFNNPVILRDILGCKEIAIQVMPIDKEAPKGRLLLPQVQALRDSLDGDAISIVVKENELQDVFDALKSPPKLVVTDSSVFHLIKDIVPENVWLTSFSILYSRLKGDLVSQTLGALTLKNLVSGDKVLISEACSHHPITDDIGRTKIPRWINQYIGGELDITIKQGHDFPANLSGYRLIILCGSCMFNRREILSRIMQCHESGVPCTNYGLVIALCLNMLERVLEPFPEALHALKSISSTQ
jgi:[FeFe] hydrogenase H-cluster maturation GTPase HydF